MAEYLPPREFWPKRVYTLPEFATYAPKFNPTEELLGKAVAAGRGDRIAVLFDDQRITYSQLLTNANKLASALRDLGVKEGDRIILRTPNIPPALVANFAILKLGAVCTPTSPLFSRNEIAHVANDSEAVAIIVSAALLGEVEAAKENLQTVQHIIVVRPTPRPRDSSPTASCCSRAVQPSIPCSAIAKTWACCSTPPAQPDDPKGPSTSWRNCSSCLTVSGSTAGRSRRTT